MDDTQGRPKPVNFGFGDDFSDLSGLKPKPGPRPPKKVAAPKAAKIEKPRRKPVSKPAVLKAREAASDKIAKSMGFASREAAAPILLKKRRRTHHDEPVNFLPLKNNIPQQWDNSGPCCCCLREL